MGEEEGSGRGREEEREERKEEEEGERRRKKKKRLGLYAPYQNAGPQIFITYKIHTPSSAMQDRRWGKTKKMLPN